MQLQDVAPRLVEPRDDDNLVAGLDPLEALEDGRLELDHRVRRALVPLAGSRGAVDEPRPDDADRLQQIGVRLNHVVHG